MTNFYRRCRECGTPDTSSAWRADNLRVMCAACYIDSRRLSQQAEPSVPSFTATMADLVRLSPAALRAYNALYQD